MSLLPTATFINPNESFYATQAASGAQTLSQSGNTVSLAPGGSSVNIATTTLVAGTAVKTTALSYNGGILSTTFAGNVIVTNDLGVGKPLDPGRVFVDGTVEPTTITDSAGLVGTAGQVLSAGVAGGSLLWTAGGGGGGSGTVTSVAVGANGLVLTGTSTVAPIISLPTATATIGQYLVSDATGTFVVKGATVNLGNGSVASGVSSVAVGASASALANGGVAIGLSANMIVGATNGVAIGANARVGQNSTAVGNGNFATGTNSTAVGAGSDALGQGCISLGTGNVVTNDYSIGIGRAVSTLNDGAVVLNGTGLAMSSTASSLHVKPVVAKTTETDVLYYDSASGLVSYGAGGGGGGGVQTVAVGDNGLVLSGTATDPILSLPTANAETGFYLATDNMGKFVVGGNTGVVLGRGSLATDGTAVGVNSTARANDAILGSSNNGGSGGFGKTLVGFEISASGDKSISIGNQITNNVASAIIMNGLSTRLESAVSSLYVKPVVAKTTETDVLYYDSASGLVSYGAGGGGGGLPATTVAGEYLVSDGSAYVTAGTTEVNLGGGSVASGANSVAIGVSAVSAGEGCVSYGNGAQTNLLHDIAIGSGAVCPPNIGPPLPVPQAGINRIAIGNGAIAYGENCISVGHTISNTVPNSIVLGNNVDSVFLESLYVKPIAANQDSTNILYYNESNGLVTYGAGGGGGGLPATTVAGQYLVSNGSAYVTAGDVGVSLGQNSSIGSASYSVAIGTYASSPASNSIAIGGGARAIVNRSIVLNAQNGVFLDSASESLYVKPVISNAVPASTDILYYNATSGLVSYGAGGGGGGVASVAVGANGLVQTGTATDPILSLPTASAVVGQYLVSDATGKFVVAGDTVNIGSSSSSGANSVAVGNSSYGGTNSVAIGLSAGAGDEAVSAGHGAMASGTYSLALGKDAVCPVSNSMCLNATGASLSASTASLYVKPVISNAVPASTDILFYNATSGLVSYGAGGLPTTNVTGQYLVSNGSAYVTAGDVGVSLGANSSIGPASYSVAIGTYASATGKNSTAIGGGARGLVASSIVLNAQDGVFLDSAVASLYVKPVISNAVPASTDILYYNATSGLVSYGASPTTFRLENSYYVAKNGSDSGDGSFSNPWLTIQHAITVIESSAPLPPGTQEPIAIVTVAPGLYTENLTFTKGYIAITSLLDAQDANEITEVTGNISIAIVTGTSDIFNKQVILESLSITGNISDTSTIGHTLYLQNSYVYCSPASIGIDQSCTVDCRTRFNNLTMAHSSASSATNPLIKIDSGDCYMNGCFLTAKSDAPAILISGSGAMSRCATSNFEYSYASVAGAIVRVTNTRLSTFGQCAFTATSGTVVALNVTTLGAPGTTGVFLLQCVLFVTGVATHAVTNDGYVYYGGNQSAPAIFGLGSGYSSNPRAIIFQTM